MVMDPLQGSPEDSHRRRLQWQPLVLAGLRIAASTIALVELLRSDWAGGVSASLAWLLFVQVERRWFARADASDAGSNVG